MQTTSQQYLTAKLTFIQHQYSYFVFWSYIYESGHRVIDSIPYYGIDGNYKDVSYNSVEKITY